MSRTKKDRPNWVIQNDRDLRKRRDIKYTKRHNHIKIRYRIVGHYYDETGVQLVRELGKWFCLWEIHSNFFRNILANELGIKKTAQDELIADIEKLFLVPIVQRYVEPTECTIQAVHSRGCRAWHRQCASHVHYYPNNRGPGKQHKDRNLEQRRFRAKSKGQMKDIVRRANSTKRGSWQDDFDVLPDRRDNWLLDW